MNFYIYHVNILAAARGAAAAEINLGIGNPEDETAAHEVLEDGYGPLAKTCRPFPVADWILEASLLVIFLPPLIFFFVCWCW